MFFIIHDELKLAARQVETILQEGAEEQVDGPIQITEVPAMVQMYMVITMMHPVAQVIKGEIMEREEVEDFGQAWQQEG